MWGVCDLINKKSSLFISLVIFAAFMIGLYNGFDGIKGQEISGMSATCGENDCVSSSRTL